MIRYIIGRKNQKSEESIKLADIEQRVEILDKHIGIGLWDAVIISGDATSTASKWTWSPEFSRLLGFQPNEFPNLMTSWSDRLHPEDAPKVFSAFGEFVSDRSGRTPYSVDYRVKMKDGTYRWFNATGGCTRDASGIPIRACGSLTDIHERKTAEALNEKRNEALQSFVQLINGGLEALASGNLTAHIDASVAPEFELIRQKFNDSIASLDKVVSAVIDTIGSIRVGLQEIHVASSDLSHRTEQQAASLEETVAALGDVVNGVDRTAKNADNARTAASIAQMEAEKGGAVVSQAVAAMAEIEQSSNKISSIISVIDEIAFQTNLLALNAGVEAARAGEAGRGFAVVAQEVRGLAQRSAEAAKEIKGLISTSSSQVSHGVELVTASGKSLEQIVAQVGGVATVIADMAKSAREQALSLKEVSTAADQMDKVTQQNAAMVEETTAAAQSLSAETEQLAGVIDTFQTSAPARTGKAMRPVARAAFRPTVSAPRPVVQMRVTSFENAAPKHVPAKDDWAEF